MGIPAQKAPQLVLPKSYTNQPRLDSDNGRVEGLWADNKTHKVGVKLPPSLRFGPHIHHPASIPQTLQVQSSSKDDNVKDNGDEEKVGGKDKLVVEEVSDDA